MHKRKLDSRIHAKSIFFRQPGEVRRAKVEHPLLRLQRLYGNRYVQQVLAPARKANGEAEVAPEVEQTIHRKRGGGQALDSGVRAQMEPAFGADFRSVRLHTDAEADTLNRALNARAFTIGRDIFFRQGACNPGGSTGRELLAHELTHVAQQTSDGVHRKLTIGDPSDKCEQEAETVARAVIRQEQQVTRKQVDRRLIHRQVQADERKPFEAQAEESLVQRQVEEEEEEEPVQTEVEGFRLQRQAEGEEKKTPEWKEREKRFELLIKDLKPKDPESNMERFNQALDKLLLTLGHEKTAKELSSKLGLDPKGRLLWQFVTNTGASLWSLKQGKLPNVIPDIRLSDNLLLDVDLGGTFQKPDLMLKLKWTF